VGGEDFPGFTFYLDGFFLSCPDNGCFLDSSRLRGYILMNDFYLIMGFFFFFFFFFFFLLPFISVFRFSRVFLSL
jgi:hypothetical protein